MQFRNMKAKLMAAGLAAALAAGGCATLDDSKNWVDIKDQQELRQLFSDKTFTGKAWYDLGYGWVSYNRADGQGLLIVQDKKYPYTWKVSGDDQICTQGERGETCRRYQRHVKYAQERRSLDLKTNRYNEFSVKDGIPKF